MKHLNINLLTIVNMSELVATRLASRDELVIEKLVDAGYYKSVSEFVRDAIKEKLSRMGEVKTVVLREIPKPQAKKEILEYFRKNPGSYASDAADALGIDIELAFDVVKELVQEGRVK